jgi:hypothetical protein
MSDAVSTYPSDHAPEKATPEERRREPARTYNQNHAARAATPSRRRVSIYVAWTYPGEANRRPSELDNRFSTMTEVRRVLWPNYEDPRFADPMQFQQGIAGSLELFFWAWIPFQDLVEQATGHRVPVFQRVDQAGFTLPLDERVLGDADTLLLFGLDHDITGQEASSAETEAIREFLRRDGSCLVIGPHHQVGIHGPARAGARTPRRRAGSSPATVRFVHALDPEGARHPGGEPLGSAPSHGAWHEQDRAADRGA